MTDRQPDPPADVAQAAGMARSGVAARLDTTVSTGVAWAKRIRCSRCMG